HVDAEFRAANQVDLPIWVYRGDGPYAGYGQVDNRRAVAAGLSFRPLDTTIRELLAWFGSLPTERQATLRAGITREREAELLAQWHARQGATG
ncbi:MAG TPA: epimerase, partial [Pseudoxanthomonas sp.]|nr:epimerase [Pseudoxanthomonas sp.]